MYIYMYIYIHIYIYIYTYRCHRCLVLRREDGGELGWVDAVDPLRGARLDAHHREAVALRLFRQKEADQIELGDQIVVGAPVEAQVGIHVGGTVVLHPQRQKHERVAEGEKDVENMDGADLARARAPVGINGLADTGGGLEHGGPYRVDGEGEVGGHPPGNCNL